MKIDISPELISLRYEFSSCLGCPFHIRRQTAHPSYLQARREGASWKELGELEQQLPINYESTCRREGEPLPHVEEVLRRRARGEDIPLKEGVPEWCPLMEEVKRLEVNMK